jgi:hypothetical protein
MSLPSNHGALLSKTQDSFLKLLISRYKTPKVSSRLDYGVGNNLNHQLVFAVALAMLADRCLERKVGTRGTNSPLGSGHEEAWLTQHA